MKKTVQLILGILAAIGAAFWALMVVAFAVMPPADTSGTPYVAFSAACVVVFAVPAILFLYLYQQAKKREATSLTVTALLRSVREIPVQDVARRVGKTPEETEVLISQAISEGKVQGYLDRAHGKFLAMAWGAIGPGQVPQIIIQAPPAQAVAAPIAPPPTGSPDVRFCRECGSRIERPPGQTYWKCPACGNVQ